MKKIILKSKAFTLAEVLVTLTLIGVVAAMTIPMVVTKVKQHEYKTAGKKAFSVMSNAIQALSLNDGMVPESYANASDSEKTNYFNNLETKLIVLKKETNADGKTVLFTSDGFAYHLVNPNEIYVDVNGDNGPTKINDPMTQWKQADYEDQEDLFDTSGWENIILSDVFYIGFDENGKSIIMPYIQNVPAVAFPSQQPTP